MKVLSPCGTMNLCAAAFMILRENTELPKAWKPLIYKGFSAIGKDEVAGSNPAISSLFLSKNVRNAGVFRVLEPENA